MPCLMLIGLARPKKVYGTVKLCLLEGDCKVKCLRTFSQAKLNRVSFRFTPKLSNLLVIITEERDFNTRYCRSKLYDSNEGENGSESRNPEALIAT